MGKTLYFKTNDPLQLELIDSAHNNPYCHEIDLEDEIATRIVSALKEYEWATTLLWKMISDGKGKKHSKILL